jgi:hypothetical protein
MAEVAAIVCGHVLRDEREIKLVVHHTDGGWQLTCGDYDHPDDFSDAEIVHLHHLLERQPNLNEIGELAPGYLAEWTPAGWNKAAHDD